MTSSHSNFLDSDSDSVRSFCSDSSDDNLPTYNVCTPEKRQRLLSASNTSSLPGTLIAMPSTSHASTSPHQEPARTPPKRLHFSGAYGVPHASPGKSQRVISEAVSLAKSTLSPNRTSTSNQLHDFRGSPSHSYRYMSNSNISSPPRLIPTVSASPSGSPLQLVERHGKTLHQHSKLAKKMETLTASIKSKMEKNNKLEEYRQGGGIRGLSKGLERRDTYSASSDGEDETRHFVSFRTKQQLKEDDKFFLPLHPPGTAMLVRPATLMTTLSPPSNMAEAEVMEACSTGDEHGEGKSDLLRHYICDCWPVMEYASRPCPMHIWEWLFRISCLCCDVLVSKASLSNLIHLLEAAQDGGRDDWPVLVPSLSQVQQILESLGTDKKKLQFESLSQTGLEISEAAVHIACPPAVLVGLTHLFVYLNLAVQCRPNLKSAEDALHIILLTAALSLDSALLELNDLDLVHAMTGTVLSLLASIPDHSWQQCRDTLACRLRALSSHHHGCLHICDILLPSSPRSEELCRLVIRHFLVAIVFADEEAEVNRPIKDWKLAWRLVKFYHDRHSSTFDYYNMHSAMCMLSMLMASSSEMDWPSREEAEMKSMLADLGLVRIKDNADRTEKVPVKQLFIYFKLEMDTRRRKSSLCQMNLLAAYNT